MKVFYCPKCEDEYACADGVLFLCVIDTVSVEELQARRWYPDKGDIEDGLEIVLFTNAMCSECDLPVREVEKTKCSHRWSKPSWFSPNVRRCELCSVEQTGRVVFDEVAG